MNERWLLCLDANILTECFPLDMLDDLDWSVLFYLYRVMDFGTGNVEFTIDGLLEELDSEECYEKSDIISALYELANIGLLYLSEIYTGVFSADMYCVRNMYSDQPEAIIFNYENLERYDLEHVLIPLDIFDLAFKELSVPELRLLLLLYKYHSEEEMDGVDPDLISLMGGIILINGDLSRAMGLRYDEIVECYFRLKELRYLFKREVHVATLKNDEIEKQIACPFLPPNGCEQIVLSLERTRMYADLITDEATCENVYTGGLYDQE